MVLRAQQRFGLVRYLQIDIQPERRCMSIHQAQSIESFACSVRFSVPDRSQCIADVPLGDLRNRSLPEFRQDVQLNGREPATGFAISFQLSLAALKSFLHDV